MAIQHCLHATGAVSPTTLMQPMKISLATSGSSKVQKKAEHSCSYLFFFVPHFRMLPQMERCARTVFSSCCGRQTRKCSLKMLTNSVKLKSKNHQAIHPAFLVPNPNFLYLPEKVGITIATSDILVLSSLFFMMFIQWFHNNLFSTDKQKKIQLRYSA